MNPLQNPVLMFMHSRGGWSVSKCLRKARQWRRNMRLGKAPASSIESDFAYCEEAA